MSMSEIKALGKLRTAARNMAKGRPLENHEECNLLLVIADEIEAEIAEQFMPCPVDADGVPIHMGDAIEGELLFDNTTVRGTVCAYHIHDNEPGTVYIRVKPSEDIWTIKELRFERCRHVKPCTLEDALRELVDDALDGTGRDPLLKDWNALVGRYADEIRAMFGEVDE